MSGLVAGLLAGYLVLGGWIVRRGHGWDRLAIGLFGLGAFGTIGASLLKLPYLLYMTFTASVVMFLGFWALAEKAQRWWMVTMAGFQLVSVLTYLVPSYSWIRLREAFILFHWVLAVAHLGGLAIGVLEIRAGRLVKPLPQGRADGTGLDAGSRP